MNQLTSGGHHLVANRFWVQMYSKQHYLSRNWGYICFPTRVNHMGDIIF